MGRLVFARPAGGRFQIGGEALSTILAHIQDAPHKRESGGVLLGRHILTTEDIVVDWVTTPQPGDRRSRSRFFRARCRHQELIDAAWRESGGTCTYLGEWHTHPEPMPSPSPMDRFDWRRKLAVDRFSGYLFCVIAGTNEVCVWEGRRRTQLASLRPSE